MAQWIRAFSGKAGAPEFKTDWWNRSHGRKELVEKGEANSDETKRGEG